MSEEKFPPDCPEEPLAVSRRGLLAGTAVMLAAALGGLPLPRQAMAAEPPAEFLATAKMLTAREHLSPSIVARALECLTAEDAGFPKKASALAAAIKQANFSDMTAFDAFAKDQGPEIQDAAIKIISALYLGYTGTPAMDSTVDDARFVSFADALMYQPTIDATVIPSYSRGHTNYWIDPPSTLATD